MPKLTDKIVYAIAGLAVAAFITANAYTYMSCDGNVYREILIPMGVCK